jgi:hypothetical protein
MVVASPALLWVVGGIMLLELLLQMMLARGWR